MSPSFGVNFPPSPMGIGKGQMLDRGGFAADGLRSNPFSWAAGTHRDWGGGGGWGGGRSSRATGRKVDNRCFTTIYVNCGKSNTLNKA